MPTPNIIPGAAARLVVRAALLGAVAASVAACDLDQLLSVETPSRLAEEAYLVPSNAALISRSAVSDYECALGAYAVASGLAANELVETTQTASRWHYDRRSVIPTEAHYSTFGCEAIGVYTPINTARYTNDQAVAVLEGWTDAQVPNRQQLIARNAAMAGFSLILLGEGFCEGVIDVGAAMTPAQLFEQAEARFDKAITAAQAANDQNLLNLARVGRARARINMGDDAGALADASEVPTSFVYNATADINAGRRNNRVFQQNNQNANVTVAPEYRNVTVNGAPDPRVVAIDDERMSADQVNPVWLQGKFSGLSASFPIATGVEARLIEAEARGGTEGVGVLNTLRARSGVGLPALTTAESADFTAALVEERRRELWLQGNRWYDIRRFNLQLTPAVGVTYAKGGSYGDQRCWPLPDAEKLANPNFP